MDCSGWRRSCPAAVMKRERVATARSARRRAASASARAARAAAPSTHSLHGGPRSGQRVISTATPETRVEPDSLPPVACSRSSPRPGWTVRSTQAMRAPGSRLRNCARSPSRTSAPPPASGPDGRPHRARRAGDRTTVPSAMSICQVPEHVPSGTPPRGRHLSANLRMILPGRPAPCLTARSNRPGTAGSQRRKAPCPWPDTCAGHGAGLPAGGRKARAVMAARQTPGMTAGPAQAAPPWRGPPSRNRHGGQPRPRPAQPPGRRFLSGPGSSRARSGKMSASRSHSTMHPYPPMAALLASRHHRACQPSSMAAVPRRAPGRRRARRAGGRFPCPGRTPPVSLPEFTPHGESC
jgi:hypothetical protein